MGKSVHVYPVEGLYLSGIPAVEHDCEHKPPCVDTGAFTTKRPPPDKADKQTEDPPDGGSLDSTEE